jgi:hypothetical protein
MTTQETTAVEETLHVTLQAEVERMGESQTTALLPTSETDDEPLTRPRARAPLIPGRVVEKGVVEVTA